MICEFFTRVGNGSDRAERRMKDTTDITLTTDEVVCRAWKSLFVFQILPRRWGELNPMNVVACIRIVAKQTPDVVAMYMSVEEVNRTGRV